MVCCLSLSPCLGILSAKFLGFGLFICLFSVVLRGVEIADFKKLLNVYLLYFICVCECLNVCICVAFCFVPGEAKTGGWIF